MNTGALLAAAVYADSKFQIVADFKLIRAFLFAELGMFHRAAIGKLNFFTLLEERAESELSNDNGILTKTSYISNKLENIGNQNVSSSRPSAAVWDGGRRWSYGQWRDLSLKIAFVILKHLTICELHIAKDKENIGNNEERKDAFNEKNKKIDSRDRRKHIALISPNGIGFLACWFGIYAAGCVPVFINYNLKPDNMVDCFDTGKIDAVLIHEDLIGGQNNNVITVFLDRFSRNLPISIFSSNGEILKCINSLEEKNKKYFEKSNLIWKNKKTSLDFDKFLNNNLPIRYNGNEKEKLDDTALLIFTSGTTGRSKAAKISFRRLWLGGRIGAGMLWLKSNEVLYCPMPLYHSSGAFFGVITPLCVGAGIALDKKFSVSRFWDSIIESHANVFLYVGETCRYLLEYEKKLKETNLDRKKLMAKHKVRAVMGNGMRPDIWLDFKKTFNIPMVVEFYAATESVSGTFNIQFGDFGHGAVGRFGPLVNILSGSNSSMGIFKLDNNSNNSEFDLARDPKTGLCIPCNYNEAGEMLQMVRKNNSSDNDNTNKVDTESTVGRLVNMRGSLSQGFGGYFGDKKSTEKKLIKNVRNKGDLWFRTGDVMRSDRDGFVYFLDRLGDTFRWKSENVATNEVEEAIVKCDDRIIGAVVVGIEVPGYEGKAGYACIEIRDNNDKDIEEIVNNLSIGLKKRIPSYAIPIFVRIVEKIALTGNNKIMKSYYKKYSPWEDPENIDKGYQEIISGPLYWIKNGFYEEFTGKDKVDIINQKAKL